jgi:ParB-like nuclease domain
MALTKNLDISFHKGYQMLRDEGLKPKPAPMVLDGLLPLVEIRTATSVMQPRAGNEAYSAAHVAALADAIQVSKKFLDPMLVWWSGKYWRVVDGHHRFAAYQQAAKANGKKKPVVFDAVPVLVFEGTLDDAIAKATECNVKDKLPMRKSDKLERAWKLTAMGTHSIQQISNIAGVAERTVSNMRKAKVELEGRVDVGAFIEGPVHNPMDLSWDEVKGKLLGESPVDGRWVERQARDWAMRLGKAFGRKFADNPSTALMSLEIYSENMFKRMLAEYENENADPEGEGDNEAE